MMEKLPQGDFQWMTDDEISKFDINQIDLEAEFGYIIECDLHYPKKLHKKHSSLPLAPELLEVQYEMLSPYSKQALLESSGQTKYKDKKLMGTFHDRIDYVVHAKNLQLYLNLGMKLKKISRILKFKQAAFIAPYISRCTEERIKATTKFAMDQFKKLVSNFLTFQ